MRVELWETKKAGCLGLTLAVQLVVLMVATMDCTSVGLTVELTAGQMVVQKVALSAEWLVDYLVL
jgi:hypothetical protein